ncbi:MAG: hypothetical protein K2R98_22915 [Gemmataceae bacterium]|nr:hypothetical protein [Gemmataceae bacterium]
MDTDLLVDDRIEDGEKLIRQLIRDQFEVGVAFWVKVNEDGLWYLYIASSSVDAMKMGEALHKVYAALNKIPACSITPMDITLLTSTDPITQTAIALRDRHPSREPKRHRGLRLGNLATEELCIYPRLFPLKVRELADGRWEVLISEFDDLWFKCDSEEDARTIAAARVLESEALGRSKSREELAVELKKTADVMEKYRMSFGSRFLRRRAQEARQ